MCQTIIFDFGGVLIDLDYSKSFDALSELLDLNLVYGDLPKSLESTFIDFEVGKITSEKFLWNLQNASKHTPHARPLIDAWNGMLLGFNPARFDLLLNLKEKYNVMLLSNTNQIHLEWIYRHLKKEYDIETWDETYFHKTYYSHEINLRKPNADIYEYVINDSGIDPSKAIFIDDSIENILTANEVGLVGIHHPRNKEIIDVIDDYIKRID